MSIGSAQAGRSLADRFGRAMNELSERLAGSERRFRYGGEGITRLPTLAKDSLRLSSNLEAKLKDVRVYLVPGIVWPGVAEQGAAWLKPWASMLEKAGVGRAVPVPYASKSGLAALLQPFTDPITHKSERRIMQGIASDLQAAPLRRGERVFLLGHSYGSKMGGEVAEQLKRQGVPVEGMIMLETHLPDMGQFVKKAPALERVLEVENDAVTKLAVPAGTSHRKVVMPDLSHMDMVLNPSRRLIDRVLRELAGS